MFYYYGRKKQIAKHYPKPAYDVIIEPFAGAASYALHADHWNRRVILLEKDPRVSEIWTWLIEEATPTQILSLPNLQTGDKSSEFLHILHAASKMAFKYKTIKVTPVLERNWEISKRVMAANLHKVKHWEFMSADYRDAPDIEATWFIDPPYKAWPGSGYHHGSSAIDYEALGQWSKARRGQIICCEGEFGDYLPFQSLMKLPGVAGKRSEEKIYHRAGSVVVQRDLFAAL